MCQKRSLCRLQPSAFSCQVLMFALVCQLEASSFLLQSFCFFSILRGNPSTVTHLLSLKFHFQFLEEILCWLMCLHPSTYLWPSACGPMVQMKPFVVSFAEQRNGPQILMTQGIFTVVCTMYEGKISKTDINRKRKYTSSEEMLLYCLNAGVYMCAFVHVSGCRHIWKPWDNLVS